MDKETKQTLENFVTMIVKRLADMDDKLHVLGDNQSETTKSLLHIHERLLELDEKIRSLRDDVQAVPDQIDHIYGPTINDITDRVRALERTH